MTGSPPHGPRIPGLRFLLLSILALGLLAALVPAASAQREEADVYVARGILAYEEKRYEDALAALREALTLAPDHPDAVYYSGLTLTAMGRLDEAIIALERARGQAPDDPQVLFHLGAAYFGLERYDDAGPLLERVLTTSPDLPGLGYYLGFLRYQKGDYNGALSVLEHETSTDPRLQQLARFYAGLAAARLGLRERAQEELESAARLLPASPLTSTAERLRHSPLAIQPRQAERRLRAEVRLGVFYDSNPAVVPEAVDDPTVRDLRQNAGGSFGEGGSLRLDYSIIRTPTFDATLSYSIFGKYNNSQTEFNVIDNLFGLTLSSGGTIGGLPYLLQLPYTFDYFMLGGDPFLRRNTITPTATLVENASNLTALQFQVQLKDYEESSTVPTDERRSGTNWAVGLTHVVRFEGDKHYVKLGYQADLDDTEGQNYQYVGHRLLAGAQYTFPWWGLRARYDVDVHFRNYRNTNTLFPVGAPGTVKRSDTEVNHAVGLWLPLPHNLALLAELLLTNNNSNVDVFTYDRHVLSLSLVWTY
jgi:tetratricopeptide (TPR) repeat protein